MDRIKFEPEKFNKHYRNITGNKNLIEEHPTFRAIDINDLEASTLEFEDLIKLLSAKNNWPKGIDEFTEKEVKNKMNKYLYNISSN